jgi:hypothetical protein
MGGTWIKDCQRKYSESHLLKSKCKYNSKIFYILVNIRFRNKKNWQKLRTDFNTKKHKWLNGNLTFWFEYPLRETLT